MELLSNHLLERFAAEWEMTLPLRPRLHLPFAPFEATAELSAKTTLRLASSRRMTFFSDPESDTVSYVSGGIKGSCPSELVPALELLSGYESRSMGELCSRLSNQKDVSKLSVFLTALAIKGVVHIETEQS
jgi:hypothetical protein